MFTRFTMSFQKYIAKDRNITIKGDFAVAKRTKRSWADNGYIFRNSIYADIEKTAYTGTKDKTGNSSDHGYLISFFIC